MIPASPDFLLRRRPRDSVIDSRDAKECDRSDRIESHRKFERLFAQDKEDERGDDDCRSCPQVEPAAQLWWSDRCWLSHFGSAHVSTIRGELQDPAYAGGEGITGVAEAT